MFNLYYLRIVLRGPSPLLWCCVLVRRDTSLAHLHAIRRTLLTGALSNCTVSSSEPEHIPNRIPNPIAGGDLPTVGKSPGGNPNLISRHTREPSCSGSAGLF